MRLEGSGPRSAGSAFIVLLSLSWVCGCNREGASPPPAEGPRLIGLTEDGGGGLLCGADFFVSLYGEDLVFVGDDAPTLTLTDADGGVIDGEMMELSVQPDCAPIDGLEGAVRCEVLYARLPLAPSPELFVSELTLTNPDVEGFAGSATLELTILPTPAISSVSPGLASFPEGGREVEVNGEGFVVLDRGEGEDVPEVFYEANNSTIEVVEVDACSSLDLTGEGLSAARMCSSITVWLTSPGELGVRNPSPVDCDTTDTLSGGHGVSEFPGDGYELLVLNPFLVCDVSAGRSVRLSDVPMYRVDGQDPMVTVDGVSAQATLDSCEPEGGVEKCRETTIAVPTELDASGLVEVVITHAPPLDVPLTTSLWIQPPFELEGATPALVSASQGPQQVVLTTTGFLFQEPVVTMTNAAGETVTLEAEVPERTQDGEPNCETVTTMIAEGSVCFEVEVTIPSEELTEAYTPTLTWDTPLGDGCNGSSSTILTITP